MKIIGLFLLIVIFWFCTPFIVFELFPTMDQRGQFGDLFGSINSLFSGLAFAGLLYTIFLQRNELALQREELRLQREEMVASREELAKQGDIQLKQYQALIIDLKVKAINMEIDAIEMESEELQPGFRKRHYEKIYEHSKRVHALVEELENG